jgi:hypothetical protein
MLSANVALLLTLLGAPSATTDRTVVVLDIQAGHGVPADLANALTDSLEIQVRHRAAGFRVIGASDVRAMIQFDTQKSKLGCQETSCLAEIGGALGAQEVISGALVRLGDTFVMTLRRVDVAKAVVITDASETVKNGKEDQLLDALQAATQQLFRVSDTHAFLQSPTTYNPDSAVESTEPARATGGGHSRALPIMLGIGALAAIAVAVYGAVQVIDFQNLKSQSASNPGSVTIEEGLSSQNNATIGTYLLIGGAVAAAGLGTGAVLTW